MSADHPTQDGLDSGSVESASTVLTVGGSLGPGSAPVGQRLTVLDELGRGGMGVVYRARDEDLGREVAVKVARGADDPQRAARFLAEARTTGQLEHPNIVPVHGCGLDNAGRPWFSMTLVRGRELADILAQRLTDPAMLRAWPLPRLVAILVQACHGVAFAHSRGVIHRDLKPANLMLGSFGEVLVMDWGLGCRHAGQVAEDSPWEHGPAVSRDGTVAGTPSYMPPEQARGERDSISPRSDVYALGALLYELLTGHPPHRGATAEEVVRQAQTGTILWPARHCLGGAIPRDLAAVAKRALTADPAHRYPSVEAFRDDLQRWLDHRPVEAAAGGWLAVVGKLVRRHQLTSAVALAALVILVGLLVYGQILHRYEQSRVSAALATAETERSRADQGRRQVIQATASAEREGRTSARGLALALIAQADALVARGQRSAAAGLLERVPADQRDWVWRHVRQAASGRGEAATGAPAGSVLVAAPTGVVVVEPGGRLRWLAADGAVVRSVELDRPVVASGSDGQRLVVALAGGGVRILAAANGAAERDLLGLGMVSRVQPLGDQVLVGDALGWRQIGGSGRWSAGPASALGQGWLVGQGSTLHSNGSANGRELGITIIAVGQSWDGSLHAAATATTVRWWSPATPMGGILAADGVGALAPGNGLVVTGEADGTVTWWDPDLGLPVLRRMLPGRGLPSLVWTADGRALSACAVDGSVRIWRDD
jgi:hypothetical protein